MNKEGVFGSNPPNFDANPGMEKGSILGDQQAPEEPQPQPEPQGQPAQQTAQTDSAPEPPQGQPERESGADIPEKFGGDIEKVKEGLANIGQKLGRTPNWQELDTPEKLVNAYKQAEREMGQTSDVDQTRQENVKLREQVDELYQRLNQMQYQSIQKPQEKKEQTPYTNQHGQSPAPEQPAQQQVQQQTQQQIDNATQGMSKEQKKDFLKRFYADSYGTVSSLAREEAQKIVQQELAKMQQQPQQPQQPQKREVTPEQREYYNNEVKRLQYKYGDEFKNYRKEAGRVLAKNPQLADIPPGLAKYGYKSGFEIAFEQAKKQGGQQQGAQPQQQQPQPQQQAQQPVQQQPAQQQNYQAQKQAARMPSPTGQNFLNQQQNQQQQMSQDEIEKQQILGEKPGKGVWGASRI